jgi:hypothetical protein
MTQTQTQTQKRRYGLYAACATVLIAAIIAIVGGGTQPICPPGPRPTYDLLALSSLSDLTTAQGLAPNAAHQIAERAATQCATVRTGITTDGSVANLTIASVAATPPTGTAAKRGPIIAQYEHDLNAGLRSFIKRLDGTKASSGSPVFGTVRRAIEDYESLSVGRNGPLIVVLLTDGLSVEKTDSGRLVNLEAPSVNMTAVAEMTKELATTAQHAKSRISVLIVGFGANAPFRDPRLDRDIAILSTAFRSARIDFRWNRSQVPADSHGTAS